MDRQPRHGLKVLLTGIAAIGFVIAAVALTFRLNMGDIRTGWQIDLWRVVMFGALLTLGMILVVPLARRRWFGAVVTGLIAVLALLTLVLAFGTTSASVAGLVLTLPLVFVALGLAAACTALFFAQTSRYDDR